VVQKNTTLTTLYGHQRRVVSCCICYRCRCCFSRSGECWVVTAVVRSGLPCVLHCVWLRQALLGAKITLFSSLLLGLASAIGAVFTYGTDPSRNAPDMSAVGVTSEEVLEILDEADQKILAIEAARDRIHNVEMKDRLKKIVTGVREITDIVEDDPRDLRRARKFLRTYLDGAQRVTEGYADTHKYGDDGELENNFRNVLDTIETVIEEQKGKLLENNLTELDVQIEVLQMQLEKEGV